MCQTCNEQALKERPYGREGRDPQKHCTGCGVMKSRAELTNGYCLPCWAEYKRNRRNVVDWDLNRREREAGNTDGTVSDASIAEMKCEATECAYCGGALGMDCQIDHIAPLCLGGAHSKRNIVVACRPCNQAKARRSPEQWLETVAPEHRERVEALYAERGVELCAAVAC